MLQYEFDDPSRGERRRFALITDRPYPGVPRKGDWILPGDLPAGFSQKAIEVRNTIFKNDGVVIIELGLTDEFVVPPDELEQVLLAMGYLERPPAPGIQP